MGEVFSISEISKLTGLPSHTIRYYEKQFPTLLNSSRTKGGHRQYDRQHLVALKKIIKLLKHEKRSIKETKKILGEISDNKQRISYTSDIQKIDKTQNVINCQNLTLMLANILERLQYLESVNKKQHLILEQLLQHTSVNIKNELLEQIKKCKYEAKKTGDLYEALLRKRLYS